MILFNYYLSQTPSLEVNYLVADQYLLKIEGPKAAH